MNFSPAEYKALLRYDLAGFIQRAFYELNPQTRLFFGDYIEVIATKLEDCRTGKIKRLIINVPPRHLKSFCTTVAFVAWVLGHTPQAHIICASYGQELSEKFARDCRKVMSSRFYQHLFGPILSPERKATHDFTTMKGGTRLATSVGGPLTGRGADFIIIDDPLKPDEAKSEPRRMGVNEWHDNSLVSRLNDKSDGCIIIIMQRLHQDDLVGHVLEQEHWEVLSLPAVAESDEEHLIEGPLGRRFFRRSKGDLLVPEHESLESVENMRRRLGTYNFAAQYQQNPAPPGGAIIKTDWLWPYDPKNIPVRIERIVQSWDTACKAGEFNDYSVCTTWGQSDKLFFLMDVFRRRLNYPDLKRAFWEQMIKHNPNVILVEEKSSGIQLLQELKEEGLDIIKACEPLGDKLMRLHTQSAAFENGCVFLPCEAPWLYDYVHELTTFPGGKHDDQVDSTTQALAFMKIRSSFCWTGIQMGPDTRELSYLERTSHRA